MTLERLGETTDFSDALIALLVADGWTVASYVSFAGDEGICMVGTKGALRFRVWGDSRADAAVEALKAATPEAA